jgi:hypothetical protein
MFGAPAPPAAPPPPPNAATTATPSVMEQGAAESARLNSANGAGFLGTDVTGDKAGNPATTKTVLG